MIPKFMQEFGMMVCDVILILECYEGALKRMQITFVQMVLPLKSEMYTALVNSEEYCNVRSVQELFQLLGPFWKPVDCSLLATLVKATKCKEAIDRLSAYLKSRNEAGQNVVLGDEIKKTVIDEPSSAVTDEDDPVATPGFQESPPNKSFPANNTITTTSDANAPDHSPPHSAGPASPHCSDPPDQPPESDVMLSQPKAKNDSLQISAKVAQDRVTWAEYDHKASLLCGLLRLPRFMLQYEGVERGCVTIKWITSEGLLPYLLSNMMDDGDLQLLLQENIVSIQIGSEYTITVGSPKYWRVSICTVLFQIDTSVEYTPAPFKHRGY